MGRDHQLARLGEACNLISLSQQPYSPPPEDESWLSALHVLYPENQAPVKKALLRLRNETDPNLAFITYAYGDRQLVKSAMPFDLSTYSCDESNIHLLLRRPSLLATSFALLETYGVRESLLDHIAPADVEDYDFVYKFLSRAIEWNRREAQFLVYTRR